MSELTNPHDRFFKEALSQQDAAVDFLRHYLPAQVTELLDLASVQLVKDSFVDPELQEHFSDLLYEVRLVEDGSGAYVYVLFEHKSYSDPRVAFQLLRYMVQVWEYALRQRAKLWPIVPVVLYHGKTAWQTAPSFHSLFDVPEPIRPFVPEYQYWLCDLSRYEDQELKGAVTLRVALLALKYIFREDLRNRLPEIIGLLQQLSEQRTGLGYVEAVLRYLAQASESITSRDLQETIETTFPEGEEIMSPIVQEWLERGIEEGLQQGLQQGRREGLLDGIELGLELRFGTDGLRLLPEIRKIEDVDVLRAVHAGLKTANNLDELRRIYSDHIGAETESTNGT